MSSNSFNKPAWLYIKRHKTTGLLYFGMTQKDPNIYLGSGKYWLSHINKHGKDMVETIWCEYFDSFEERQEFATFFSDNMQIVESNLWANLIPENGFSGSGPLTKESKEKLSAKLKGFALYVDKAGNKIRCSTKDERVLSGELIAESKNRLVSNQTKELHKKSRLNMSNYRDINGARFYCRKDDARVLSGELIHICSGVSVYVDKAGNKIRCSTKDERVLSGELIAESKYRNIS
jgi:hypothetical protein